MPDDGSTCPVCGRQDNETGMFIWIMAGDDFVPFCPGECIGRLIKDLRADGLHQQADELTASIAQQMVGGWRDNVRLLEQQPHPEDQ